MVERVRVLRTYTQRKLTERGSGSIIHHLLLEETVRYCLLRNRGSFQHKVYWYAGGLRPLRPRLARHLSDYPLKRGAHLRLFARQLLLAPPPLRLL